MRERTICRRQMILDLMRVYREVVENQPQGTTQTEVYKLVVQQPAQRFYVDPRRAHQRINMMMRGDMSAIDGMSPLKQQMYRDLYDVVLRLYQKKAFWRKKPYCVVKEAVLEPAPRFYIDWKRMEQIWREKNVETRQQYYKKLVRNHGKGTD